MTMIVSNQISAARILTLKSALKLETLGMTRRGRSAYSIVKEEFGFKGTKKRVLEQLQEYCDKNILNP